MTTKMDIDDAISDAHNVYVSRFRWRTDRRGLSKTQRAMEDTHVTITASVDIAMDDPRAIEIATALARTLAQFGL
jgi:hypothetical protein